MAAALPDPKLDRRGLFRVAGGAAALGGVAWAGKVLAAGGLRCGCAARPVPGGTDGWIACRPTPAIAPFHPDVLAPGPFTTYIFGFRNVTGMNDTQRLAQKNKAQHSAPLFWVDPVRRNTTTSGSRSRTSASRCGPISSMRTRCTGTASAT